MVLFITSYINITLFAYIIYSLIIITLISRITKGLYVKYPKISELSNDEFFVMNESFSIQNIFSYITYKLYNKKILFLNAGESNFSLANIDPSLLTNVETEVYNYYKNNYSADELNESNINTNALKNFYDSTYQELNKKHIFKSKQDKLLTTILFDIGLLLILIPGLLILIVLWHSNIELTKMIVGLIISCSLYFLILKSFIATNLTPKGYELLTTFKYKYNSSKFSNKSNSINKLLIQNHYMYYFVDDDDDDNDD